MTVCYCLCFGKRGMQLCVAAVTAVVLITLVVFYNHLEIVDRQKHYAVTSGLRVDLRCVDYEVRCSQWAKEGWCVRAKQFMTTNCSSSCGICGPKEINKDPVSGYAVYTPSCRIIDVDPWDSSITRFVKKVTNPLPCMKYKKLANLDKGVLTPTEDLLKMKSGVNCHFEPVKRAFIAKSDDTFTYGSAVELPLSSEKGINVSDDLVHVYCKKDTNTIYDDFLTQTYIGNYHKYKDKMNMLPTTKADLNVKRNKIDERLNVLVVGVDSMSRLNGHRQLSKLRKYMLNDLNGIELNGFNRVGDNTFLNVCPLTMGKTINELKWDSSKFLDDEPLIWKRFMAKGYASLYAEDATDGTAFNYLKKGFSKSPTHHYFRPLALAMYNRAPLCKKSPKFCCGRKGYHQWTLDYGRQFATTYHAANISFFGFVFNTIITHDDLNAAGHCDDHYTEFVRYIKESDILNNTVVIVFGDHGFRFGGIRGTYIGRYEENLAMLFMALPPWFSKKYPDYDRALRHNQHMLTTPFDVHQTIRDLCVGCQFDKPTEYGISLFEKIPDTRKCPDAGIPVHYCACREEKKLNTADSNVVQASKALVSRINELNNKKKDLCLEQSISKVIAASTSVHDQTYSKGCTLKNVCYDTNWHKLKTSFVLYLVTIQTQPGVGQFQATVRQEKDKFEVMGDISRINRYGNTSSCIKDDFNLRKFCYCRSNIPIS